MEVMDMSSYPSSRDCYFKMVTKVNIRKLLKEHNRQLYSTLQMFNKEKLENLLTQLTEEVNIHYNQVLREVTQENPIGQLPYLEYSMAIKNRMDMAREITMEWLLSLKVMQRLYFRECV